MLYVKKKGKKNIKLKTKKYKKTHSVVYKKKKKASFCVGRFQQ